MRYKALAIDLDGTLLVGDDLSTQNREAVQRARDAGLEIIIATARWRQMAEGIAAQLGIEKPIIAASGAQVYIPKDKIDIFDHRLPDDFIKELYELCNISRCIATVTIDTDVILKLDGQPDLSLLPDEMVWVKQLDTNLHKQPRIAAIQGSGVVKEIKEVLGPRYKDAVNIYDSIGPNGKLVITITAAAANKGKALLACCQHLDIDPQSVVTFGDAENDIEMFKVSGASVAMGQAADFIKRAATHVTADNTEHGVASAIDRLLKTGQL
ncbi:MAG: Cof subfamily protein (haloacid dehalogenase superfamily) [Candidatus Azotimanducaceae bacterium]|jgi:Cof subfamily protein (haloacid dehalogenase superfamily)